MLLPILVFHFLLFSGFFIEPDYSTVAGQAGVFKTGQWYMLGVQVLTAVLVIVWTAVCTWITLTVRYLPGTSWLLQQSLNQVVESALCVPSLEIERFNYFHFIVPIVPGMRQDMTQCILI